jgi:hypothetical protein
MDNIRPVISKGAMQSEVHAVIESRGFAKISNFHASFLKQAVEVAFLAPPERNDCRLISLRIQSCHDVNRHALGAAGVQRRKNMNHSNLFHDVSRRSAKAFL